MYVIIFKFMKSHEIHDKIFQDFTKFITLLFFFKSAMDISSSVLFNLFLPNATYVFLMFSGGREKVHWEQMG